MKIMICLFVNLALIFSSCGNNTPKDTLPQAIKEIWIYDYFLITGYTTAKAYGQINRLEEVNTPKFKLEQNDVDSLCRIMQETLSQKVFHTKVGQKIIFAEFVLQDGQKLKVFIARGLISVDCKKEYWVKDEKKKEWFVEIIDRIWKEHSTQ